MKASKDAKMQQNAKAECAKSVWNKKLLNDLPTGGGNQISLHVARLWPLVA
jgi:hypothetical protein